MEIIKINKISGESAEITLSDGSFEIICLADPFEKNLLCKERYNINCYDSINLQKQKGELYNLEKLSEFYSYKVYGKVIDRLKGLVKVGGFMFFLDKNFFPGGINESDFVEFECSRFDLY
jgi:hypothetical protein